MSRLLLALLLLGPLARASDETLRTFEACWRYLERHFYDQSLHGKDARAIRNRYRPLAQAARPGAELHALLQRMLGELKSSHAAILENEVYDGLMAELRNQRYWTFGLVLEETRPGQLFLRMAFEGGPAAAAGLRVGDRVVLLDGVDALCSRQLVPAGYDPNPDAKPLSFLRAAKERELRVTFQRRPGGARRETTLVARRTNAVDAMRASVRSISYGAYRIGTLHIWYCSSGVVGVLREALRGPLSACDALVLDLRGRGGYRAVGDAILRIGREFGKPIVLLIDERTRSAKEVLAFRARRMGLLLVGRRTEGAVLGAGFFSLPDQSVLELPVTDVVTDGVRLEGRGVGPDYEADRVLPYAAGRDTIVAAGLRVAARGVARRRGWKVVRGGRWDEAAGHLLGGIAFVGRLRRGQPQCRRTG